MIGFDAHGGELDHGGVRARLLGQLGGSDQARLQGVTAIGKAGRHHRQLERRRLNVALADTRDQRLARMPAVLESRLLPGRIGDQATLLTGQIDAGGLAEAEASRHGCDAVDADLPRYVIEIDIAGMLDPAEHVEGAVAELPQQWKTILPRFRNPGQKAVYPGSMPPSRAASAVMVLKVEPGGYCPARALLISGWPGSVLSSCQSVALSPRLKAAGSKLGVEPMASTSPVMISSTTAEALCCADRRCWTYCCSPISRVLTRSAPGLPS